MRFLPIIFTAVFCSTAMAFALVPTVTNSGFESGTDGWGWQVLNGAQVSFSLDTVNPHTGKQCIVFKNNSGITPHVYGRFSTGVSVLPSTRYELSCWVRAEDAGTEPGSSHITDWSTYTLDLPGGTYDWKRVSTEFTTRPDQYGLNVGINITNKCKALAVDDIVLRPLGGQLKGEDITGVILANPKVVGPDAQVTVYVLLENPSVKAAAVDASVVVDGRNIRFKRKAVKAGENQVNWDWNTGKAPFGNYDILVHVLDKKGTVLASGTTSVEIVHSPILDDIARVEARKPEFDALYRQCKSKGINLDYPTVTRTMLEQFIPLAKADVRAGIDWKAAYAVTDFNRSLDNAVATMKAYLADPKLAPVTRRYRTGKIEINDLSFIGDRTDSTGKTDRGPVFFCGHGHFLQVRKDVPRFPGYGVNIIQIEIGPSHVFPKENKVDLTAIRDIQSVLDNAAKHNIVVNVLLSPHYFPGWALEKWPHLLKASGGFLSYCVDDPVAKQILEKYLRIVIPMIKDKPALHSLCLTNEPVFANTAGADNTKGLWTEYLTRTHKNLAALNKRYGTDYASFADVPYNGEPQAYDWIVFNQQRFAGWHGWMADVIHEMAPDIPLHAKVMSTQLNAGAVVFATDQELFGNTLDINGNDCYWFPGNLEWPVDPWHLNTSYDMQRSFARKPVFNSENHISPDGSTHYMTPGIFRSALWQGAVHGQGATTLWVWEHANENLGGIMGHAMDRPGCAEAVGAACLDLNRFAEEVTALETQKASVAILYAMSSIIRRGNEHTRAHWRVYQALDHCGVKIDYITEKQLAEGKGREYKAIIVPEAETLRDDAFEGIRSLPASTRLILLNDCFVRNEYGKKRDPEAVKEIRDMSIILPDGDTEKVIWPAFRKELDRLGVLPIYSVVDAKTGEPIWGVEWLPARLPGRTVINIINFRSTPFEVKILRNGAPIEAKNLLSLGAGESVGTLNTLEPVLAEISRKDIQQK